MRERGGGRARWIRDWDEVEKRGRAAWKGE